MLLTRKKRQEIADQANANSAIEGFELDAEHKALQERFVAGELDLDDVLDEIRAQAAAAGDGSAS